MAALNSLPGIRVLVVNAGSSSLKLRLLDEDDGLVLVRDISAEGGKYDEKSVVESVRSVGSADAVGHRIVHGGTKFASSIMIDDVVERELRSLVDLAPLHQPKSLAALDLVSRTLPGLPAVACFDTAFHATMPAQAATYAVPYEWRRDYGVRRYGFHGLSHSYAARRSAELLGVRLSDLRVVTCHLGSGASLAAVHGGRSVDTTMGFTPLDGLVMATRSGSVDPGLVLWLQEHLGLAPSTLADELEHRSGLKGLAGTGDMRAVLEAEKMGDPSAGLAVDVYVHRLRAGIAAMAAAMEGLDALVFTGGVGERSPEIRARAVGGLGFLGVGIDPQLNLSARPDVEVGLATSPVRCLVVAAREDLEIAAETRRVLSIDRDRAR